MRFLTIKNPETNEVEFSIDFQETPMEYRDKRCRELYKKYPIPPKGNWFWMFSKKEYA